tara:strand:+ start:944 stop:1078 length:135 start_codon:yes stop_codon:yes gene_type:complete
LGIGGPVSGECVAAMPGTGWSARNEVAFIDRDEYGNKKELTDKD